MKKKSRRDLIVFPASVLSRGAKATRERLAPPALTAGRVAVTKKTAPQAKGAGALAIRLQPKTALIRSNFPKSVDLPTPPPTVRECLAMGFGPYRTSVGRVDMTVAHAKHLIETYPTLYKHADSPGVGSSEPFAREGFSCGDGWFDIIDRLSAKLSADPNLAVAQLKEKMGTLRVYFCESESPGPRFEAMGKAALDAAIKKSAVTCELCGAPGKLKETRRHWLFVRCKSCSWLAEIEEACRRLVECGEGWTSPRSPRGIRLDAARRHVQHIGVGASRQSPGHRARLPGVDWQRLDLLRRGAPAMRAAEIFNFVRDEVPALAKALR